MQKKAGFAAFVVMQSKLIKINQLSYYGMYRSIIRSKNKSCSLLLKFSSLNVKEVHTFFENIIVTALLGYQTITKRFVPRTFRTERFVR